MCVSVTRDGRDLTVKYLTHVVAIHEVIASKGNASALQGILAHTVSLLTAIAPAMACVWTLGSANAMLGFLETIAVKYQIC